jgi:hypothetical protein
MAGRGTHESQAKAAEAAQTPLCGGEECCAQALSAARPGTGTHRLRRASLERRIKLGAA